MNYEDRLISLTSKKYIKRAIEMKCIACGISMITYKRFKEGYHIQLCEKCRLKQINKLVLKNKMKL